MANIITIGVDARFYGPVGKGLGRYTKEVLDRMIVQMPEAKFVIFLSPENFDAFVSNDPRVKKVLVKTRWYTLAEQLVLPWLILREKINIFHSPHFNVPVFAPCKLIVTIHDLILINFPTTRATTLGPLKYWLKNQGYKLVIWLAIKRATAILAVSQFTKDDILNHFSVRPEKITVTLEGVADFVEASENSDELLKKLGIVGNFALYVGNVYPHKNLEGLIKAYAQYQKEYTGLQLVLVGRMDYFYMRLVDLVADLKLEGKVIFADYLPDSDLVAIYKKAIFYIFPSYYEGFGLPPLEAMAHGLPVASSNQGSMPEVLGEAALYFDPGKPEEIIEAMSLMSGDNELRKQLIAKGKIQVSKYSWDECARQTVEVVRKSL